jgi:hypothetical protein
MFNAVYVLPLALVLGVHLTLGARSKSTLARAREAVQWLAAPLLATVTLVGGSVLLAHGASGLIG